jgi:hypothetical protein
MILFAFEVMLFKFMDTNFRGLRQNCIFMDTKIYGSPAIVNAYEYGDIYSMNSTFRTITLIATLLLTITVRFSNEHNSLLKVSLLINASLEIYIHSQMWCCQKDY